MKPMYIYGIIGMLIAVSMSGCIDGEYPVYKTIYHTEPIYETLYSVELRDASIWGDEVYRKNHVYDTKFDYTGDDSWGNAEYTVTLYYYNTVPDGTKLYSVYYQIDEWYTTQHEAIVGYHTWSEQVIDHYESI